jgi:hypothetical protein
MIKGVNKRVIEINNPESIYFERAIFYLKPGVKELPSSVADAELDHYLRSLGLGEISMKRRRKVIRYIFTILALMSFVIGIMIAFIT